MARNLWVLLAAGGSGALMLGALAFQHLGGLHPCPMCIWQRYPHVIAILLGAIAFALSGRVVPGLGALAALATAGVGVFHVGVEQKWWDGPTTCTSQPVGGLSTQELFDQIMSAPVTRCDDIAWQMWGISMAGWNALISLGLAVCWVMAVRQSR